MTLWPRLEKSDCATNRAATSVGPPAGNGTTILMIRSGYPSARLGWVDTVPKGSHKYGEQRSRYTPPSNDCQPNCRTRESNRHNLSQRLTRSDGGLCPAIRGRLSPIVHRKRETSTSKNRCCRRTARRSCLEQGDFGAYLHETRHVPGARDQSRITRPGSSAAIYCKADLFFVAAS